MTTVNLGHVPGKPHLTVEHEFMLGGGELLTAVADAEKLMSVGPLADKVAAAALGGEIQILFQATRDNLTLDGHTDLAVLPPDALLGALDHELQGFQATIEQKEHELIEQSEALLNATLDAVHAGWIPVTPEQILKRTNHTTVGFMSRIGENVDVDSIFIRNVNQMLIKPNLPPREQAETVFHELGHAIVAGDISMQDGNGNRHTTHNGLTVEDENGDWLFTNDDEIINDSISLILLWNSQHPDQQIYPETPHDLIRIGMQIGGQYQRTKTALMDRYKVLNMDTVMSAFCKANSDPSETDQLAKTHAIDTLTEELQSALGPLALRAYEHPSRELDIWFGAEDDELISEVDIPAITELSGRLTTQFKGAAPVDAMAERLQSSHRTLAIPLSQDPSR